MRKTLYCLVDFDNATKWNKRFTERRPKREDVGPIIFEIRNAIEYLVDNVNITFDEYQVRFYGGWRDREHGTTELAIWLARGIEERPCRIRGKPVIFAVAYGLINIPGLDFEETCFHKRGLTYIRKQEPFKCQESKCSFWEAIKNYGKKCPDPSCGLQAADLFYCVYQKTVDTIIALDTVTVAKEFDGVSIAVFSSDYDLVPAILLAREYTDKIYRITRHDTEPEIYNQGLLELRGVKDIRYI